MFKTPENNHACFCASVLLIIKTQSAPPLCAHRSPHIAAVAPERSSGRGCSIESGSAGCLDCILSPPEYRIRASGMAEPGGASAYGAALAGGGFDFHKFVRQPQTIVRLLSWVFALVVFACLATEGYVNPPTSAQAKCIFNQNDSACQYAVGIGVIAFLACIGFLLLDVYVPFMSNAQERKYTVMADLGFSGLWTFLWFVCFCLLASQWARTLDVRAIPEDAARATIAFSFFSIATWGILTYFALGRFRRGVDDAGVPAYTQPDPDLHTPYPTTYAHTSYNPTTYTPTTYTYPSNVPESQKPPPFTSNLPPQGDTSYLPQGDTSYLPPKY